MRIVFIGTVESSYKKLEKTLELGGNVVGVVTKEKSSFNSDYKDLSTICYKYSIPILFYDKSNEEELEYWIRKRSCDVIFCFGWSHLIKKNILNIPAKGVIGFHPTKLPFNRGRHPMIWALGLGLQTTASTFFVMDDFADSGDILSQKEIKIDSEDTARSLYDKIISCALEQIEEFLPKLISGDHVLLKQNHKIANNWRKRSTSDEKIDFRMSSNAIYNLVRSLTHPYCGAHILVDGKKIKVWKVREVKSSLSNIEYGKILKVLDSSFVVKTIDAAIEVIDHDFKVLPNVGEYL